jgi:hypothetical protein
MKIAIKKWEKIVFCIVTNRCLCMCGSKESLEISKIVLAIHMRQVVKYHRIEKREFL